MTSRPEHFKGTQSEYLAASYYLKNQCQVYWPADQHGPVDFIVENPFGDLDRVQVKTAYWKGDYLQCRTKLTANPNDPRPWQLYDYLHVVADIGQWVVPAHLITSTNLSLASKRDTYRPRKDWSGYKVKGD